MDSDWIHSDQLSVEPLPATDCNYCCDCRTLHRSKQRIALKMQKPDDLPPPKNKMVFLEEEKDFWRFSKGNAVAILIYLFMILVLLLSFPTRDPQNESYSSEASTDTREGE